MGAHVSDKIWESAEQIKWSTLLIRALVSSNHTRPRIMYLLDHTVMQRHDQTFVAAYVF